MKRLVHNWGFEKKMKVVFSTSIVLVSLLVLCFTIFFTTQNLYETMKTTEKNQLEHLAENYDASLKQYKNICVAILMNYSIQNYLRETQTGEPSVFLAKNARDLLVQIYNSNDNINFISLVDNEGKNYIYRGITLPQVDFERTWEKDWKESQGSPDNVMRLSYNNNYFKGDKYTLTIYYPAYSNQILDKSYGMLSINFDDIFLENISNELDDGENLRSKILLVEKSGKLVSGYEKEHIDDENLLSQYLTKDKGDFKYKGNLITYNKIGDWDYYLLSVVSLDELYAPIVAAGIKIILLMMIIVMLGTMIADNFFMKVYEPLDKIVQEMSEVSNDRMDIRINAEPLGKDFESMANGFNAMMDRLEDSIEEIKLKQEQLSQTRLNALQAQIHPHFLYNTLECIHWQAVAEGNKDISNMVKALASYYRICLSKGKDIITLEEELQHIQYYIIIQNMRYDEKIQLLTDIPSHYMRIRIPKLTLQPLVENAIEHGIDRVNDSKGLIQIWIEDDSDKNYICLRISNNGNGMTLQKVQEMNEFLRTNEADFGYGVRNVNRRIELFFGQEYGLHYDINDQNGVTVTIRLPKSDEEVERNV